MKSDRRAVEWSRWAGQLSDIEAAVKRTAARIQEWTGKKPPIAIVVTLRGRVVERETWEEFRGSIDTRDLKDLVGLKIDVGDLLGPRASIHFESKSPALSVEVVGNDAVRVEGVFVEATRALAGGRQLSTGWVTLILVGAVLALVVCGLAILSFLYLVTFSIGGREIGGSESRPSNPFKTVLVLAVIFGGVTLGVVGVNKLFPILEVLPECKAPALARLRGALLAAVVAFAISLIASYIYGEFSR
jgi:hypothetical protein